jgi:dienelactone hydrolase
VILSALLLSACDTNGPEDDSDQNGPALTSTSVTVQSDTLGLPGTLLVPDTNAAVPGVVVVHGSGPVDRDGPGSPPVYKEWSTRMAQRGLAVLRYDKRTTQPEATQADPRALTFLDLVRDAVAAGILLRNRQEVDGSRIVFVGHSQGGNVAPAAATRLENMAGVASLAGPALAVDSLFVAQLEANGGGPNCTTDQARAQFDSLRAGRSVSDGLICGAGTTFWRQWMRHSQKVDSVVAALEPPLLAQQGRADRNYPAETLQRNIDAWRRVAQADAATVEVYDDVDHLFRKAETSTTADVPLDDLITWIHER